MSQLEQTVLYTLRLEHMSKRHGGWWLELINRATGEVKILMSQKRNSFKGVTINDMLRWTTKDNWEPMYKKNVM